jgi:hypothetical protein
VSTLSRRGLPQGITLPMPDKGKEFSFLEFVMGARQSRSMLAPCAGLSLDRTAFRGSQPGVPARGQLPGLIPR